MPSSILVDFKRLQAKKNTPPTAFCTSRSILGERRLLSKYFSSTQCISTRIRGIRTLKVREESYQLIHSVVTVQASSTVPLLEKPSWTQTPMSANVTAVLLVFILLTAALAWQRRQHLLGLGSQTSMCQSLWEDADHWRLKKRAKIRQAEHISSALRLLGEGNRRDTKAHSELVKVKELHIKMDHILVISDWLLRIQYSAILTGQVSSTWLAMISFF